MLVLIGNSPSSGSTFLSDLLDSSFYSASGVEIGIFSNRYIYDFNRYKKHIFEPDSSSSIYSFASRVNINRLHKYGLNADAFSKMVYSATDFNDFARKFAWHFTVLRGKSPEAVVFEKSPGNLNAADLFLNAGDDNYFIHIQRNPLYVYNSLKKRSFPPFISLITWFVDIAKFIANKEHERIINIKYEDLVKQPFKQSAELINRLSGKKVQNVDIEKGYYSNVYRRVFSEKLSTWSFKEYGNIADANKKIIPDTDKKQIAALLNYRINKEYARIFGLKRIYFIEALEQIGYKEPFLDALKGIQPSRIRLTSWDYKFLLKKWILDVSRRNVGMSSINAYINPVEKK